MIRSHVGDREDRFFATVFLGSGLLFVAMLFAAAAAAGAPLVAVKFQGAPLPSPDAIGLARGLASTFLYVYGVRAAAVFMISVSMLALRTGSLPRWLVIVGLVVAVIMVSRRSHGDWEPAAHRPDPVELLEEQATTRVPELVPIRYGRMLVSPFTFYRGAAYLMASDLASGPRTSLHTQLCGDAHLSNFQNEKDYAALKSAVEVGRVSAEFGL